MRIDMVPSIPADVKRSPINEPVQPATETNVLIKQQESPVLPAPQTETYTGGNNAERETVWLDEGKRPIYLVRDQRTGDVLCQLPSEEVLRIARNIDQFLKEQQGQELDIKS
ncbi:MAG TPA: hypothetical protein VN622_12635 [Clostridia bacterium]|nr:hypothetical protein [Clostridia bacterium]